MAEITEAAKAAGADLVAITDAYDLHHVADLTSAAERCGVEPVIGYEAHMGALSICLYARTSDAVSALFGFHNHCLAHGRAATGIQERDLERLGGTPVYCIVDAVSSEVPPAELGPEVTEMLDRTFSDRWYATRSIQGAPRTIDAPLWSTPANPPVVSSDLADRLAGDAFELPSPALDHEAAQATLASKVAAALDHRFEHQVPAPVQARVDAELARIDETKTASMFVIAALVAETARDCGIELGPGRGSACASYVCYALGVTKVDPLRYGLLFDRFLPLGRHEPPDIDFDVAASRREDLASALSQRREIKAVARIQTRERFSYLSAFNASASKAHIPVEMSRLRPGLEAEVPPERLATRALGQDSPMRDELCYHLRAAWEQKGRLVRWKTHAASVVISGADLSGVVPYAAHPRDGVAELATDHPEAFGLAKIDLCSSHVIEQLYEARRVLAADHGGTAPRIVEDPAVYQALGEGTLGGVFQFRSAPAIEILSTVRPSSFRDLVACVALNRPATRDLLPEYAARKNGHQHITYPTPDLEPVLAETYGLLLYQEQFISVAQVFAGMSAADADAYRRAAAKASPEVGEWRKRFHDQATARGRREALAKTVETQLESAAGYSFAKAHAVPYARIAYLTAYFEHHHPELWHLATVRKAQDHQEMAFSRGKLDFLKKVPPSQPARTPGQDEPLASPWREAEPELPLAPRPFARFVEPSEATR